MNSLLKSAYHQLNLLTNISIKKFSKSFKNIDAYTNSQLEKFGDLNKIVETINKDGYFMFNQLLNQDVVNKLNIEFDFILKNKNNSFKTNNSNTFQHRCFEKNNLYFERLIYMFSLFNYTKLLKIINLLFKKKNKFNSQIFFQETKETLNPVAKELHFDKLHQFKIWLFLNDIQDSNGPIEIFPKSHTENETQRVRSYNDIKEVVNLPKNNVNYIGKKMIGNAGSLLIFNSDLYHRATNVTEGYRRIARGHSMSFQTLNYSYEFEKSMRKN